MATIAYVLLFLTLSSTIIHARDSQFFNKVSNNPQETQPLNANPDFIPQSEDEDGPLGHLQPTTTTNHLKETRPLNTNQDFIKQSTGDDGSFGHQSGHLQPTKESYVLPENYNLVAHGGNNNNNNNNNMHKSVKQWMSESDSRSYSSLYKSQQLGSDDARFTEETDEDGGDMYNSHKQGFEDASTFMGMPETRHVTNISNKHNSPKQGMGETRHGSTKGPNMYNPGKQGMGDIRHGSTKGPNMHNPGKKGLSDLVSLDLEAGGGKHTYDISIQNLNVHTTMNTKNGYNTQGYYEKNENSYHNSKEGFKSFNKTDLILICVFVFSLLY